MMKHIIKGVGIVLGISLCVGTFTLSAQLSKNEWGAHVAGGAGLGLIAGNAGLNYSHLFSLNWGLSTGVEVAQYFKSKRYNENTEEQIETPYGVGLKGDFFLRTQYDGIEDKQTLMQVQVPLVLQFQWPINREDFFYARIGGKFGLPMLATGTKTAASLTTKGYSNYTGLEYENVHEFGTQHDVSLPVALNSKPALVISAEAGVKWEIAKRYVYTGLYVDVGSFVPIGIKIEFAGSLIPPPKERSKRIQKVGPYAPKCCQY